MKKILICGLGAVGLTFGTKILESNNLELKVLVDKERFDRYKNNPPTLNNIIKIFDYILPGGTFAPDLIIIATKAYGLNSAINMLKNFVKNDTKILSLINGISSEDIISQNFPQAKVLKSYFIGHSAVRDCHSVTQDGIAEIVFERDDIVAEIFRNANIDYSNPNDMDYALWLKFAFNIVYNQISAILNMNFGELKQNKNVKIYALKIINEIKMVAEKKDISGLENLEHDVFASLNKMCDEGKTSMLQDILAGRKTEVDIFSGEIIRLGQIYGIPTPYNEMLYNLIKIKEENNEYSIHTC